MNKKAFSLIEVIVAVVLLATVGLSLLKISSNSKKSLELSQKEYKNALLFSIPYNHHDKKFHNSKRTLFDFVRNSYTLDDISRKRLKEVQVTYKQKEFMSEVFPVEDGVSVSLIGYQIDVSLDKNKRSEPSFEIQ